MIDTLFMVENGPRTEVRKTSIIGRQGHSQGEPWDRCKTSSGCMIFFRTIFFVRVFFVYALSLLTVFVLHFFALCFWFIIFSESR